MATLLTTDFAEKAKARLAEKIKETTDKLSANLLEGYLQGIQAERYKEGLVTNPKTGVSYESGGHIHEAVVAAVSEMGGELPLTKQAASKFESYRSYDEKAKAAGKAIFRRSDTFQSFRLVIRLPFAATVEKGGTLKPIEPGGNKLENGLYGRRAKMGSGWLMWDNGGGQVKFGKRRTFSSEAQGVGALSRAIQSTTDLAATLGWIRK